MSAKTLKAFALMVAAAGAGAVLVTVGRIVIGIGWDSTASMMREQLFLAGLDSALMAVLCGAIAMYPARGNAGRAFLLGLACGSAPFTVVSFVVALVAVVALWKFMPPLSNRLFWMGGALAFLLAPLALLLPIDDSLYPHMERPIPLSLAENTPTPASGSPDVVLLVCDTLRADAIFNKSGQPNVPMPNLDALRASGTWSKGAVAPANQTLPSHLSLLFALDIELIGMRNNRSRWPTRGFLRDERGAKSLAQRFSEAGYRTHAVVSNKLLSTAEPNLPGAQGDEQKQWLGEGFDSWWDASRNQDSFLYFLKWTESNTLLGFLASNQIVLKKRPLNFFLKRMTVRPSLMGYRMHFEEGEFTVDAVKQTLHELTVDDRPYFLFTNFMEPHDPYLPPPAFAGTIAKADQFPQGFEDNIEGEFQMRRQVHVGSLGINPEVTLEKYLPTSAYLHNLYREEVTYFDSLLGRTLELIRATGRPTILLFVGDHGEGFGFHSDPAHGHTLFESEMRVPFILHGVGIPEGMELPFAPELVDGSRTLLELAGVETKYAGGRNVLSPDFTQRATLTFREGQISTFDGRWKLHANFKYDNDTPEDLLAGVSVMPGQYDLSALYLFDLIADPEERNNLLELHPQEADRLLASIRLRLENDSYPELPLRSISNEEDAHMASLGYVGDERVIPAAPPKSNSESDQNLDSIGTGAQQ